MTLRYPSHMPRVLVFGTFDHLHPGHKFLLREGMKRGDLHVVIARDANVEKIKGKIPDEGEEDRLKILQEAFPEAEVVLGDSDDFLVPVRDIQPDLILLGYDQKFPPGVSEDDLPCSVERLEAFEPERWKSSIMKED